MRVVPKAVMIAVVLAFLKASFFSPPALGTSVVQMDVPGLSQNANIILEGRVTNIRSAWNSTRDQIYTYVTVNVTEVIAGQAVTGPMELRFLGGAVDNIAMVIADSPSFVVGERVLLFLQNEEQLYFPFVGMSQGKLFFRTDPVTGREVVGNDHVGYRSKQSLVTQVRRARSGR
jgi:hypothetical protein